MDGRLHIHGTLPRTEDLLDAVRAAAETLDATECWLHDGRYHFALGGGWSIALSSDSADRIRVEACRLTRPMTTMWTLAGKWHRLAGLVSRLSQVAEPV